MVRIVHAPQDELDPRLAAALRRITAAAWPGADERHDPLLRPELFVLVEDERVTAGLGVLRKPLRHGGRFWLAAGLSAVVVDPALRGAGRGTRIAAEARRWILDGPADLGLFTCDRPLARVYERAGWTVLADTALVGGTADDPFPSDSPGMDEVVLAAWRPDDEDAIRATFPGTRVPLHPGTVDRLW